ncbi:hypothetical protein [Clostridium botulinum]|uniref:hypothetical protein n=1 Tax=Clostridium botulinum TaxID=1491 RepID=UPI0021FDAD9A|nr:hypothetical protein [Clostridium botulinum]QDY27083.1 hypothetical protein CGQ40_20475 [Clostridium botulinum]
MIKIFDFLKKKEKECDHDLISLGKFYTINNTAYTNEFDHVDIFIRIICTKCKKVFDRKLGYEQFLPELHSISNRKKENFISKIEKQGTLRRYEIQEKTMKYIYNIKEVGFNNNSNNQSNINIVPPTNAPSPPPPPKQY